MADNVGEPLEIGRLLQAALARKPRLVFDGMRQAFRRDGQRWLRGVRGRFQPSPVGEPKSPTAGLSGRSGFLGKSLFAKVEGNSFADLALRKGTTTPWAITHEVGTAGAAGSNPAALPRQRANRPIPDIVPVRRKWLTIPTAKALYPSGVPRRPGARAWPDLVFIQTGKERALLLPKGFQSFDDALYILRKRVAIPPRLGMRRTHEDQEDARRQDIRKAIREALAA